MKLYHGSNILIREIDFSRCRPYKDFGQGFYLTEIEEQAIKMADRTATIYGGEGIVCVFEFDKDGAFADKKLSIKEFATPNEEWALFVMGNRDRAIKHPTHSFGIVIEPVADDEMATQFRYFKDGIIDLKKLVSKIRFHKVSSQYFFHTDKAIKYLKPYE